MPGVPKVERCQGCKRRRVKPEEGSSPSASASVAAKDATGPWLKIRNYKPKETNSTNRNAPGYGFFRLSRQPSSTPTERLSSYLITQSSKSPDLIVNLAYLKHLPRRLSESPVLTNCLNVFCNCWSNFQRGLPPAQLIDARLYGLALRSLHAALNGPAQLRVETLTAMALLQRIEVLFDVERGNHQTIHSGGMIPLMIKKGPPSLDDPLDMHLAHEVQTTLAVHWLVHRGDNFMLRSPWIERLQEGAKRLGLEDNNKSDLNLSSFVVDAAIGRWPEFLHEMNDVHSNDDPIAAQGYAKTLQARLKHHFDQVYRLTAPVLKKAAEQRLIRDIPGGDTPNGFAYEFATLKAFDLSFSYCTVCLILKLMIHSLNVFQNIQDETVWSEYCLYCSQMTKYIPYLRNQGQLGAMLYISSFCLAFEGATETERVYMRQFILWTDDYRQRFPRGEQEADDYFIYVSKALTGRRNFVLTPRKDLHE
ncbi:putative c6 zinc finger domain protein [Fusarium flagelliforme]|uniref:Putative c6 zinc finger domain protein n=1 Tax=Fusarium flagelliforme TaxID=2675880 RepID=A0A395MC66_9HYPO|nr:putative c6 zinc finger domain protein [Fusarium flagelliforme]